MEKNTQQLENEIEYLKHEIYLLKQSIHRLAVTYIQDSKYPYWGKLLCFKIDEDKKMILSLLYLYCQIDFQELKLL